MDIARSEEEPPQDAAVGVILVPDAFEQVAVGLYVGDIYLVVSNVVVGYVDAKFNIFG
jgi:hypothetical protein